MPPLPTGPASTAGPLGGRPSRVQS